MLRHKMRPRPEGFGDQVDAGSRGDVADLGRDIVERGLAARIDRHRHVVLAEDQAFGFQIVLGEFQLLPELTAPSLAACMRRSCRLIRPAMMLALIGTKVGDHHVNGQVQLVEHQAVGLGGIVLHREDRAELVADGAVGERDGCATEGHAGIGPSSAITPRPREERVLFASVEEPRKPRSSPVLAASKRGFSSSK